MLHRALILRGELEETYFDNEVCGEKYDSYIQSISVQSPGCTRGELVYQLWRKQDINLQI